MAFCCGTTTAVLYRMKRTSSTTRTRTISVLSTGITSLRTDVELKTVDGHDAAALSRVDRRSRDVVRGPEAAAQLGTSVLPGLDRGHRQGDFADHRIDDRRRCRLQPRQQRP